MKLNIGCGRTPLKGWINVDRLPMVAYDEGPVDIIAELDADRVSLPLDANTCDEFLLSHVLEHINKPLPLMQELHRIAKPGAVAVIRTPYGSSDDAWEDPTHVRPYFINSFGYFSQPFYWRADYGYRGDWRVKNIKLFVAASEVTLEVVKIARNVVQEMVVALEAVKPIREPKQELQEAFPVELVGSWPQTCGKFSCMLPKGHGGLCAVWN